MREQVMLLLTALISLMILDPMHVALERRFLIGIGFAILTSAIAKLGESSASKQTFEQAHLVANSSKINPVEIYRKSHQVFSLNKNWKCHTTHETPSCTLGSEECFDSLKIPESQLDYNDGHWKSVSIPHDFVIERSFNESTQDKDHGYLPLGYAWYRKRFRNPYWNSFNNRDNDHTMPELWRIEFQGCMCRCHVYLNHRYLGNSTSGYVPFWFETTLDMDNILVVMADATQPDSWWYDGGGLYRHVTLLPLNAIHIAQYGVYAPSLVVSAIQSETIDAPARADAVVMVSVEVKKSYPQIFMGQENSFVAHFEILDDCDRIVAFSEVVIPTFTSKAGVSIVHCNLTLASANLWSINHPSLYTLETSILSLTSGKIFDTEKTTIGVRKLSWDPDLGFFLNDVNTKILGVANHQDFAGLGIAIPDSLQAHRVAKIQELGGNAWRTAHNPPNMALLDATDRMGMLVWDENHRNGETEHAKVMVRRDRNRPSIIIWSICNEILCDCGDGVAGKVSLEKAREIKVAMNSLDPYGQRVVSANQNEWITNDTVLDLLGFDYNTDNYDFWHSFLPQYPAISSESSSEVGDRGEYANDPEKGHVSGHGTASVPWGQTTEKAWGGYDIDDSNNTQGILTRPFVAGGFTWTGFDYKGEPTPYAWPDVSSHFGIYDIAGFEKDRVGWYKSWWPLENNKSHIDRLFISPHWNWYFDDDNDDENVQRNSHLHLCQSTSREIEVRVYSNAACVELFHNGVSCGRRRMPRRGHLGWNVTYTPGNITARSYKSCDHANALQEVVRVTTGPPFKLSATFKDGVGADGIKGDEVALIQVDVLDAHDRLVPIPNEYPVFVKFEIISGNGKFIGSGNGDPADTTCDKSPLRKAYHGLALGIVQAAETVSGWPDYMEVMVSSYGLLDAVITVVVDPNSQRNRDHMPMVQFL